MSVSPSAFTFSHIEFQRLAMKKALDKLGYNPYHLVECIKKSHEHHLVYWHQALEAKYLDKGKPYGRTEFDKFLGNYDVRFLELFLCQRKLNHNSGCYQYSVYHVC